MDWMLGADPSIISHGFSKHPIGGNPCSTTTDDDDGGAFAYLN
jgi:hypothetical protein